MPEAAARARGHLPTLTEVVECSVPPLAAATHVCAPLPGFAPGASDLAAEVLFELENRVQHQLETRLREALAPALARVADGLIREARQELSSALHDLVEEAVVRAMERRTHA